MLLLLLPLEWGQMAEEKKYSLSHFIVGQFLIQRRLETCRNTRKSREGCVPTLSSLARDPKPNKHMTRRAHISPA